MHITSVVKTSFYMVQQVFILGPTGNSPRNTPHFVQLIITWTSQKSNGPSDLVQGIH